MNIFGVGLPEMALILVLALLVFGPKKLPEIGRSLAQALGSFKKAQQEFETEFKKEAEQIQKSVTEPMKASIERPEPKALSSRPEEKTESHQDAVITAETVEDSETDASQPEPAPAQEDSQAA
ncbi:MAG: TatA/E family twin arginine-targeting protein translocase [Leptolyngbya sp. SIO1D8]|nr:TatA/E family twin arginine-targeting protein translocase [Leptolyngbya sp. SIO1D8]